MYDFNLSIILYSVCLYIVVGLLLVTVFKKKIHFMFYFSLFYVYLNYVVKYAFFPLVYHEVFGHATVDEIIKQINYNPSILKTTKEAI